MISSMASVSVVHWTDTPRLVRPLGHFLFRETAHPLSGGVRSLQKLFFSTENLISASLSSSRIFFRFPAGTDPKANVRKSFRIPGKVDSRRNFAMSKRVGCSFSDRNSNPVVLLKWTLSVRPCRGDLIIGKKQSMGLLSPLRG